MSKFKLRVITTAMNVIHFLSHRSSAQISRIALIAARLWQGSRRLALSWKWMTIFSLGTPKIVLIRNLVRAGDQVSGGKTNDERVDIDVEQTTEKEKVARQLRLIINCVDIAGGFSCSCGDLF